MYETTYSQDLIKHIMDEFDLDDAEARDYIAELQDDADYMDEDERIGCGDCFGDAL